jgi:hypothetical protein
MINVEGGRICACEVASLVSLLVNHHITGHPVFVLVSNQSTVIAVDAHTFIKQAKNVDVNVVCLPEC